MSCGRAFGVGEPMRRGRADSNQRPMVDALRSAGAQVVILSAVGKGCPDLLVGYAGANFLIETKNGARSASYSRDQRANLMRTPDQDRFHKLWTGQLGVAFTPAEALKIIGVI